MKAIAVDFGGSHASCGLVEDNRLLDRVLLDFANPMSLVSVLPEIETAVKHLLSKHSLTAASCIGIAVGLPSLVDARTGVVFSSKGKYEDASEVDLPAWSRERLGLELRLENDARLALLGESYAGGAIGCSNIVMITLGTGVGGTTMIEGKLLRGVHSQAGCLGGHFPVLFNGRPCMCGAIGCAEAEASSWALPLIAKEWPGIAASALAPLVATLNFEQLFGSADSGDAVASQIRDRCLEIWSVVALAMVHAYDPEIILMGGGVLKRHATIVPFVQTYLDKHTWTPWGKPQVKPAQLGNNAALFGAIPLLTEKFH